MTLVTQDRLEQIYQTLKNQYACRHESSPIVCFYDLRCFFLLPCMQEVSKNRKSESRSLSKIKLTTKLIER